jgi:hypothetical protein
MRISAAIFAIVLVMPVLCAAQSEKRLEGCIDPQVIATVLSSMRQNNAFSVERVRSMWPTDLNDVEDSSEVNGKPILVRSIRSDDRKLYNHYECGTKFSFLVRPGNDSPRERLNDVTINYSAHRRATLVALAKLFAGAVGLESKEVKTIGNESSQDFSWDRFMDERRIYLIFIEFTREAGLWKLHFSTSWQVVEPLKSDG